MSITLYGLKNCDTCRAASKWLTTAGYEFKFVDLRQNPVAPERLAGWLKTQGWEICLNRRSRTWRELDEQDRDNIDENKALALMQAHPTLIKRPVLEHAAGIIVGFSAADYAAAVASAY